MRVINGLLRETFSKVIIIKKNANIFWFQHLKCYNIFFSLFYGIVKRMSLGFGVFIFSVSVYMSAANKRILQYRNAKDMFEAI